MEKLRPETWQHHKAEKSGVRIDAYLAEKFPELSRARVQKLIEEQHILVNDKATKANCKLKGEEKISVYLPAPAPTDLVAEDIPLKILFEDADLIVLDKSAGMVVHPSSGHSGGTLVNALLHHAGEDLGMVIGGEQRPGIVHRIDKNTSGILVISKNDKAHQHLSAQFKAHTISRKYLALCWGLLPPKGEWKDPLGRDPKHRQRVAVVASGRSALTKFRSLQNFGELASYFEAELFTGRTHQIRVHFASHGFPLVGDAVYTSAHRSGRQKKERALQVLHKKDSALAQKIQNLIDGERQFLHAAHLGLEHPSTGKILSFTSPLPSDLQSILDDWKKIP